MKRFIYYLILFIPMSLLSQELTPIINFAFEGFYLDITNKIEKNRFYKILRKQGRDTNFKQIAKTRAITPDRKSVV